MDNSRVLVSMTNGDIYYISRTDAIKLEELVSQQSSVLFVTYDVKNKKNLKLQPLAVSSMVEVQNA